MPKITIEQTELPIVVQHRCKRCNRPINHYGMGKDCERKVIEEFKGKIPKKYYPVILKFLKGEVK